MSRTESPTSKAGMRRKRRLDVQGLWNDPSRPSTSAVAKQLGLSHGSVINILAGLRAAGEHLASRADDPQTAAIAAAKERRAAAALPPEPPSKPRSPSLADLVRRELQRSPGRPTAAPTDVKRAVQRLWNDPSRFSMGEIGEQLGITKNAVAGIIGRLRAAGEHVPSRADDPMVAQMLVAKQRRAAGEPPPPPKPRKPQALPPGSSTLQSIALPELLERIAPAPRQPAKREPPPPTVHFTRRRCEWVDGQGAAITRCPEPTQGHRYYCPEHRAIVYRPRRRADEDLAAP